MTILFRICCYVFIIAFTFELSYCTEEHIVPYEPSIKAHAASFDSTLNEEQENTYDESLKDRNEPQTGYGNLLSTKIGHEIGKILTNLDGHENASLDFWSIQDEDAGSFTNTEGAENEKPELLPSQDENTGSLTSQDGGGNGNAEIHNSQDGRVENGNGDGLIITDYGYQSTDTNDTASLSTNSNGDADILQQLKQNMSDGIVYTERLPGGRMKLSRYKSGRQQVSNAIHTLLDSVPRHANSKLESPKAFGSEKVETGAFVDENLAKRKKRVPSSTTPSAQIIILIIGGVVGCVLLTGFIRWRVVGRKDAKKDNATDDCENFENRPIYHGDDEMETIYECEYEEGQKMMRLEDRLKDEDYDFEEGMKTEHVKYQGNFDTPFAFMNTSHSSGNHARLFQFNSSTDEKNIKFAKGDKRVILGRQKRAAKGRYAKHLKRKMQSMYVQKLETIPMESRSSSQRTTPSGSPSLSARLKPSPTAAHKRVLNSLVNSWRSLSFNRDWVGKGWQEQHNIRRLSDLFRRSRDNDSKRGSRGSVSSSGSDVSSDVERLSHRLSMSTEYHPLPPIHKIDHRGNQGNTSCSVGSFEDIEFSLESGNQMSKDHADYAPLQLSLEDHGGMILEVNRKNDNASTQDQNSPNEIFCNPGPLSPVLEEALEDDAIIKCRLRSRTIYSEEEHPRFLKLGRRRLDDWNKSNKRCTHILASASSVGEQILDSGMKLQVDEHSSVLTSEMPPERPELVGKMLDDTGQ